MNIRLHPISSCVQCNSFKTVITSYRENVPDDYLCVKKKKIIENRYIIPDWCPLPKLKETRKVNE
jgi:hypothetical protein